MLSVVNASVTMATLDSNDKGAFHKGPASTTDSSVAPTVSSLEFFANSSESTSDFEGASDEAFESPLHTFLESTTDGISTITSPDSNFNGDAILGATPTSIAASLTSSTDVDSSVNSTAVIDPSFNETMSTTTFTDAIDQFINATVDAISSTKSPVSPFSNATLDPILNSTIDQTSTFESFPNSTIDVTPNFDHIFNSTIDVTPNYDSLLNSTIDPISNFDSLLNATLDSNPNATFAPNAPSSAHAYYAYFLHSHYVFTYVLNPVAAFGILGNALTFYVLYRRRAKTPPIVIMMALAVFDSILLIIAILEYGLAYASIFSKRGLTGYRDVWAVMRPYLFTSSNVAQTVIVWLTLFLSVERYNAICKPLKFMANCTHQRAIRFISIIVVASVALNLVKFFEVKSETNLVTNQNTGEISCYTNPGCINSPLRINRIYWFTYYVVVLSLLVHLGPFLVILVVNVQVIHAHRASLLWRQQHFQAHVRQDSARGIRGEQHSVTLICVAVVLMFLICALPENVLHILMLFLDERSTGPPPLPIDKAKVLIFNVYCILLISINSSVNFLLYSWFSASFRCMVKDLLFGRCLRYKRRHLGSSFPHFSSRGGGASTATTTLRRASASIDSGGGARRNDDAARKISGVFFHDANGDAESNDPRRNGHAARKISGAHLNAAYVYDGDKNVEVIGMRRLKNGNE